MTFQVSEAGAPARGDAIWSLSLRLRGRRLAPRQRLWFADADARLAEAVEELWTLGAESNELAARVRAIAARCAADTERATGTERATDTERAT